MYEAYRVRKTFQWDTWEYAPSGSPCACQHEQSCSPDICTGRPGTTCACPELGCRCACRIPEWRYGGDIWIVEAGHPRKDAMLSARFAVYDSTIPDIDTLLQDERYARLLQSPQEGETRRRERAEREPALSALSVSQAGARQARSRR